MEEAETGMSEHIGFDVDLEGAEETIGTLTKIQSNLMEVTSLIGTADYTFTSWSRVVDEFSVENFLRSILATISFMQALIVLTNAATVAQHNLNVAQAAGGVSGGAGLAGPLAAVGLLISLSLATYGIVSKMERDYAKRSEQMYEEAAQQALNRALYEEAVKESERHRREKYRSVVP